MNKTLIFITLSLLVIVALSGCSDVKVYEDDKIICYHNRDRYPGYFCYNKSTPYHPVCEYTWHQGSIPPDGCYK